MSRGRIVMSNHLEILRLRHDCGLTIRRIAEVLGLSVGLVHKVVTKTTDCGIRWPLPDGMDEDQLAALVYGGPQDSPAHFEVDFTWVHQEKQKKAVTLQLLWQELCAQGYRYSYSSFCEHYARWKKSQRRSMRQFHEPGDTVFVDFCGMTVKIGTRTAQIFVGVLGASNYTFAVAVWTQQLRDWLECLSLMLEFFKGCPKLIVSDNLGSAVAKACRYDPQFNFSYQQWAEHYGVAVKAARPRKPKDKAKVEQAVQNAERWILARLRNHHFTSLSELNAAIRPLVDELNLKPFSNRDGCRQDAFDTLDRPVLRPLPLVRFHYVEIKTATVGFDYHIKHGKHWYSVPHQYAGQKVKVHLGNQTLRIFFKQHQIATHRIEQQAGMSTHPLHRPKSHDQSHWPPARLKNWAAVIGADCSAWVCARINEADHFEQVCRRCLGVLSLSKKFSNQRLNAACRIANRQALTRVAHIEQILKNGTDLDDSQTELKLPQHHDNIRGAKHFN